MVCLVFGHRWDPQPIGTEKAGYIVWDVHVCRRCPQQGRMLGGVGGRRYWSRPTWRLRFLRKFLRWMAAGRPRDLPVVVRPGRLLVDPDGKGTIADWHFDVSFMTRTVAADELWDRLSALYPVERIGEQGITRPAGRES